MGVESQIVKLGLDVYVVSAVFVRKTPFEQLTDERLFALQCAVCRKKTILPACKDFLRLLLGEKTISFPLCHQVGVRLPAGRLSIRGLTSTDFLESFSLLPTFATREFFYYPWYMEHAFSKGCHNFLAKGFNLKSSRYFGNFLFANRKFITAKTIKCNHFMFETSLSLLVE